MSAYDHHFISGALLAEGLAEAVAKCLREGIVQRGRASLAVSGGRTPLAFFAALSWQKLDWSRVFVTLADERWVPQSSERSNTRLVYQHLLVNEATPAHFVPLVSEAETPEAGLDGIMDGLEALPLPLDAVVLGMGDDGHTASWFPDGDNLTAALMPDAPLVLPMHAPAAPEPRITFTAPALLTAQNLFLHFEGAAKRGVYEQACAAPADVMDMPVRAALNTGKVQVYWCG